VSKDETGPAARTVMRSSRRDVRNPVLRLPATLRMIEEIPPDNRRQLGTLLRPLADQAAAEGEKCWRGGKAMMGAYWRVVAVYSRHIAHAIDPRSTVRKVGHDVSTL